jgi:cysteine synthase
MRIYKFQNNPYDLVFNYIFDEYKRENKLNDETTIIYPGLDIDIISISNLLINKKLIVIARNDINDEIKNIINNNGHELITIPASLDIEELILMAEDIKLDIDNSLLINLFKEKKAVSAYFKNSKDIYESFKEDKLYLEIRFGIFTGIAKYFKMQNFDIKIIGIKTIDYDSELIDFDLFDEVLEEPVEYLDDSMVIKI